MKHEIYLIEGMSCAACSSAVERVTRKIPGVERSDVNLTTTKMDIEYDETQVTPELIMAKVAKAGFGAKLYVESKNKTMVSEEKETDADDKDLAERLKNLTGAIAVTVILLYVSMGHMVGLPLPAFWDRSAQRQFDLPNCRISPKCPLPEIGASKDCNRHTGRFHNIRCLRRDIRKPYPRHAPIKLPIQSAIL